MKILVVIDAQNDFITGTLPGHNAVAVADSIAHYIASSEYDEIPCTLDTHTAAYPNTQEGWNLPVPHCQVGTPGWDLYAPFEQTIAASGIPSHRFEKRDNFGCPQMVDYLKAKEPSSEA